MNIMLEHGARVTVAEAPAGIDQSFGYLFGDAAEVDERPDIGSAFEMLAAAMAETPADIDSRTAVLPPVFTYFGQFIDHDITLNTDSDNEASDITAEPLPRRPRGLIEANVMNGRMGALNLDSVYGDVPAPDAGNDALKRALRDGAMMRLGRTTPVGPRPELPRDDAADLPRLGQVIDEGHFDPQHLPADQRPDQGDPDDPLTRRAFVGDGRNDENLIVAQLHLAVLRFHNAVVRTIRQSANAPGDGEALFRMARRTVIWTYQWLVVNQYLPAICRPQIVRRAAVDGAPLYTAFLRRLRQGNIADTLPLPLEFSVAGFRFGHSMVRDSYDYNRNFGRSSFSDDTVTRRASLDELFAFTGNGPDPFNGFGLPSLPQNWIIEWDRFVEAMPLFEDRLARPFDTRLAASLFRMRNRPAGLMQDLARRNLRRGYNMNLPCGQEMLARMRAAGRPLGLVLTAAQLTGGSTGQALRRAGLADQTPLWFYIHKEAEVLEAGARLGSVGSTLVADTIIGLIANDPGSYWSRHGSGSDGRWHPRDGVMPGGRPVTSIQRLLQAAGVLAG